VYSESIFDEYEFTVVTPKAGAQQYFSEVFRTKRSRYLETNESNSDFAMAAWKELFKGRYDLLHSHGFTSGILSALAARVVRVPHIMTAHDVLLDRQFRGAKGKLKLYLIGLIFYLIDIVMAVGDDAKENLAQNYPRLVRRRCLVSVRNGIDV